MTRRYQAGSILKALIVLGVLAFAPLAAVAEGPMDSTIAQVKAKWPQLQHATPAEVQTLIDSGKAVLFDVRTKEEYAVSHLPGAVLVDPATSREAFIAANASALKGKTPVFYCAVGVRSSKLTEHVGAEALSAAGAAAPPLTMAGGIFQWNWENRPLVNEAGSADVVHSYDAKWGRLTKNN